MNARPAALQTNPIAVAVAATLAAVACIAGLSSVVNLFLADGTPMQRLVVAEQACASYRYASERQACVQQWLIAAETQRIAGKEN